jgi:hypothetical protein
MTLILWTIAALVAGLLAIVFATRLTLKGRPALALPPGERLPSTPLQRLARWCIVGGSLFSVAAAVLIVSFGPKTYYGDERIRLTVTALLLAAIAVFAFFSLRVSRWVAREDALLDERDRAIYARAPVAQSVAMLVTLAVWLVGLQESFASTRLVPMVYLHLVFWSCIVVNLLALPVGVLLGYRRD